MLNFNDAPSVSAPTHGTNGSVAEVPDGSLDVAGSTFRDTNVGHHIKSRAQETIVRDSILDDGQSHASYSIDLPNGGRAILEENALTQTDSSGINTTMVAYGAKGNLHSQNSLLIKNNLFIDNHANGKGIDNHTNTAAILQGNTFSGCRDRGRRARRVYRCGRCQSCGR